MFSESVNMFSKTPSPIGQLVDWSVYFAQICFCKETFIIIIYNIIIYNYYDFVFLFFHGLYFKLTNRLTDQPFF